MNWDADDSDRLRGHDDFHGTQIVALCLVLHFDFFDRGEISPIVVADQRVSEAVRATAKV